MTYFASSFKKLDSKTSPLISTYRNTHTHPNPPTHTNIRTHWWVFLLNVVLSSFSRQAAECVEVVKKTAKKIVALRIGTAGALKPADTAVATTTGCAPCVSDSCSHGAFAWLRTWILIGRIDGLSSGGQRSRLWRCCHGNVTFLFIYFASVHLSWDVL